MIFLFQAVICRVIRMYMHFVLNILLTALLRAAYVHMYVHVYTRTCVSLQVLKWDSIAVATQYTKMWAY